MKVMLGSKGTNLCKLWIGGFAMVLFLAFPLPSKSQMGLPEGPGKDLVATICTQCHGLNSVTNLRLTQEEWDSLVNDMIARGAPVFDDEYKVISQYLGKNFGKGAGNETNSSTAAAQDLETSQAQPQTGVPDGQGKELVETICSQCHALSLVTNLRFSREVWVRVVNDMISRGAAILDDEIEIITQYLGDNYGTERGGAENTNMATPQDPQASQTGSQFGLPEGPGRELVETVCTHCHRLTNVITLRLSYGEWESLVNDMIARGAPVFDEDYKVISQYLSDNFGK